MIPTQTAVAILAVHWFADFVLQKDAWARAKWASDAALLKHVVVYAAALFCFLWPCTFAYPMDASAARPLLLQWVAANAVLHFVVDRVTSVFVHFLFEAKRYHDGFVVIGLDQLAHVALLLVTYARVVLHS